MNLIEAVNKQRKHAKHTLIESVKDLPNIMHSIVGDLYYCSSEQRTYINIGNKYIAVAQEDKRKEHVVAWS